MSLESVAIIGTAGRKPVQLEKLDEDVMLQMEELVIGEIRNQGLKLKDVQLVSGGSAWCDHVAVRLWNRKDLEFGGLLLYLPCDFSEKRRFHGTSDSFTLNVYHGNYEDKTGRDPWSELEKAFASGAIKNVKHRGFFPRNAMVAKSDRIIAFKTGKTVTGGTGFTWKKSTSLHKVAIDVPDRSD